MLTKALTTLFDKGDYIIYVGKSDVSKMIGQGRKNLIFLKTRGFNCKVKVDESLSDLNLRIEKEVS